MGKKILFANKYCGTFTSYGNASSSEAAAFITATGITDTIQINAIRELVNNLKGFGLWSKIKAVYPMIGGSAITHKYNLKDPRDLDAAFRLVFNGGWIHSSTGAKPNGTTGYADTKLIPSVQLSLYNAHLSYYSRTQILETSNIEIGIYSGEPKLMVLVLPRQNGSMSYIQTSQDLSEHFARSNSLKSTGFFFGCRTSSLPDSVKYIVNGKIIASSNANGSGYSLPTQSIYLGAINDYDVRNDVYKVKYFSSKECSFASIGMGFGKCEAYYYYKMVQLFQTQLGRQV